MIISRLMDTVLIWAMIGVSCLLVWTQLIFYLRELDLSDYTFYRHCLVLSLLVFVTWIGLSYGTCSILYPWNSL